MEVEKAEKKQTKRSKFEGALFDYATGKPDGFTNVQAMRDLGLKLYEFNKAKRDVVLAFEDDSCTLICEPNGKGQPWVYRLVGDWDGAEPWATNRSKDLSGRLRTCAAMAQSIVQGTDGRTPEGKSARRFARRVTFLRDESLDLAEDIAAAEKKEAKNGAV